MGERWRCVVMGDHNTVRRKEIKIQMCAFYTSCSDSAPAAGRVGGGAETEVEEVGMELMTLPPPLLFFIQFCQVDAKK